MKNKTIKRISIFGIMLLLMIIFSNTTDATVYYSSNNLSTFTVKNANWVVYSDYIEWTSGGDDQLSLTEDMTGNSTFYVRFEAKLNPVAELSKAVYDSSVATVNVGENGYWNGDCFYYDGSSWNDYCNNDGNFHNYTYRYDETNSDFDAYKDGVNICANCSYDARGTSYAAADIFYFRSKGTKPGQIRIQDFCISSTIDESCFGGPAPGPSNTTTNTSHEKTVHVNQITNVTVTGFMFASITSGSFELLNASNVTIAYVGNTFSTNDVLTQCRVFINSDDKNSTIQRTSVAGDYGSYYMTTDVFYLGKGNHTFEEQCRKISGIGNFEVANSHGTVHILNNGGGIPINYRTVNIDTSVSSTSYSKIATFKFNTSAENLGKDYVKDIVIDGYLQYDYVSTGDITLKYNINGTDQSEYARYGEVGTSGIIGSLMSQKFVLNGTHELTIDLYGKSSSPPILPLPNANITGNLVVKEFIYNKNESASKDLNGTGYNGLTYTTLETLYINNSNVNSRLMIKAGISQESTSANTRSTLRIMVNSSAGEIMVRDLASPSEPGVSIISESFNVGLGNHTVYLQGRSDGQVNIIGGDLTAYLTDVVSFEETSYTVTAYNEWNNTQIRIFNITVDDNLFYSTTTGSIIVTPTTATEDVFFQSEGYLNKTVLNHPVTTNLNASMYQSRVQFRLYEVYTGNLVTNFTVNGPVASYNTTNGTYNLKTNLGLVPINITVPNYYNLSGISLNVTSTVQNINLFEAYQSKLRINLTDIITGLPINNFTANISNSTYSYTAQITTTNGTANFEGLMPGNFTLNIDAINYALTDYNFSVVKGLNNLVFQIFTTNSVNFTIYDAETNELITGRNINIELIGDFVSYNYSTTTGTYYADLISPASYKIRTIADGYEQTINTFTLENRTYNQVSVYMLNSSSSTDVTIQIVNKLDNSPLEGYFVKVLQYSDETGSYLNTQTLETDFDGKAVANIRLGEEFYRFFVLNRELTLVESTNASYIYQTNIIIPVSVGEDVLLDYENEQGVTYSLVYNDATDSFRYEFDDSMGTASQGCIKVYRLYSNEQTLINTTCQTGSSGIILNPITPVNGSTFVAKAYVYFGNEEIYLTTQSKSFKLMDMDDSAWLFYDFLLTAAIAIAFVWSPTIMVTLIPLPSLMLSILGLVPFDWGIMIVIQIIFLALGSYLGKRG